METLNANLVNSGEDSMELILSEAREFCKDYWIHPKGFVVSTKGKTPRILKEAKGGYNMNYSFIVVSQNGKTKPVNIHRVVAETFIPNPLNKQQVNHINGNTDDNSVANLEWVTPKENSIHAHATGLSPKGSKCPWAKTTEDVVEKCYKAYLDGLQMKEIVKLTGLSKSQVSKITSGKQWRHVTEPLERATTIPRGSTL